MRKMPIVYLCDVSKFECNLCSHSINCVRSASASAIISLASRSEMLPARLVVANVAAFLRNASSFAIVAFSLAKRKLKGLNGEK